MLNHIVLMGRLTRDPELRYTGSNVPVASFRIAVDRDFGRGENGERQTDFIDVVAWRQTGEFVSKYFTKGSMAVVSGRLQMRDWTDRDGNKRTSAEVVADNVYFGDSKRRDDGEKKGKDGQVSFHHITHFNSTTSSRNSGSPSPRPRRRRHRRRRAGSRRS
jgi:single-strand DNA-binding protein